MKDARLLIQAQHPIVQSNLLEIYRKAVKEQCGIVSMLTKENPIEADVLRIFEIQLKMLDPGVNKPWHEINSSDQDYLEQAIYELSSIALLNIRSASENGTLNAIKRFCDLMGAPAEGNVQLPQASQSGVNFFQELKEIIEKEGDKNYREIGNSCEKLSNFLEQPNYSEFRTLASLRDSIVHRHSNPCEKTRFDWLYEQVSSEQISIVYTDDDIKLKLENVVKSLCVDFHRKDCSYYHDYPFLSKLHDIFQTEGCSVAPYVREKIERGYKNANKEELMSTVSEFNDQLFRTLPTPLVPSIADKVSSLAREQGIGKHIEKNFWYHPSILGHSSDDPQPHFYDLGALNDLCAAKDSLSGLKKIFSILHQTVHAEDYALLEDYVGVTTPYPAI